MDLQSAPLNSSGNLQPFTCLNFHLNFKTEHKKLQRRCIKNFFVFAQKLNATQNDAENGKERKKWLNFALLKSQS